MAKMYTNSSGKFLTTASGTFLAKPRTPEEIPLCFTAEEANSTVTFNKGASITWTGQYSTDNITWNAYTPGSAITLTNIGDKVYFKGDTTGYVLLGDMFAFSSTGKVRLAGNIQSMHVSTNFATITSVDPNICYSYMFAYTGVTDASELLLPATTLTGAGGCYRSMFEGCSSLATAPALPATTLASGCYTMMFYNCNSLVTGPAVLPATTLESECYSDMFNSCTSLVVAPALPATTLANDCYRYMFQNCTSLTVVPELPATAVSSDMYRGMFDGCTSLQVSSTQTATAPYAWRFPAAGTASTSSGHINMFRNCAGTREVSPWAEYEWGLDADALCIDINYVDSMIYYTQNPPVE